MAFKMDEAHRADSRLERDLREQARALMLLTTRHRIERSTLAADCSELARKLTKEADHIVAVWD